MRRMAVWLEEVTNLPAITKSFNYTGWIDWGSGIESIVKGQKPDEVEKRRNNVVRSSN